MTSLTALQTRFGHQFKKDALLTAALTHPSFERADKKASDYERLEFLGDRVLSLLIAEWLFETFSDENEGELAKRHAALVNRDTLSDIASAIHLEESLQLVNAEDLRRGRVNILSDAMEALIGATYRDTAGDMAILRAIVRKLWFPFIYTANVPQDPKSALQEWAQARGLPLPEYILVSHTGPAHAPTYVMAVQVKGEEAVQAQGSSKREAEKKAAATLWEICKDRK
jgi:ribonuclease-3